MHPSQATAHPARHRSTPRVTAAPTDSTDRPGTADTPFPLTMAGEGERVRIRHLAGGKSLVMRLTEIGLNLGTELRVVQRQGGGLVVARGETRVALGGGMASKVLVTGVGQ